MAGATHFMMLDPHTPQLEGFFGKPKMSRTPYKGDAETAENERECSFWLFGL